MHKHIRKCLQRWVGIEISGVGFLFLVLLFLSWKSSFVIRYPPLVRIIRTIPIYIALAGLWDLVFSFQPLDLVLYHTNARGVCPSKPILFICSSCLSPVASILVRTISSFSF
ncbi:uncharacterized protein F4812DRAFT_78373 [Daldinia caldariorum]|uniref:uncharacterized protein n=1 Tax=Daldinia caldariorum TaxID=326644 RepID=UPI002008B52A|nr:uncharacterized protein F4812DRAFT_78373 [Daldinia caldariorum]KAI1466417.1 hypothetical protein F4812DRAFT_78373 [Daldinia caldariorum]